MHTTYQFAHHRTVDGERCLIWGNGIGEVLVPVDSPEYLVALRDRAWQHNDLVNQGETDMLNVYYRSTTRPTIFYGRMYNDVPVETDTLATLMGEVTGTGYAAVTWVANTTDFGAPTDEAGGQRTLSSTKTYTAGGPWTVATSLILATSTHATTTGLLIAWSDLSADRTLANLDTLDVSIAIRLS